MKAIYIGLAIFFTLIVQYGKCQTGVIEWEAKYEKVAIGEYVFKQGFKSVKPPLNKILEDSVNYPFAQNFTRQVCFPTTEKDVSYVLKFKIKNKVDTLRKIIIVIEHSGLHEVEFFEVLEKQNIVSVNHSGNIFDFASRANAHRFFVYQLDLGSKKEHTYVLYLQNKGKGTCLPIYVYDAAVFYQYESQSAGSLGFFYGVLAIMCMTAFYFYVVLRQKVWLYFTAYCVSVGVWHFYLHGLAYQILWSGFSIFDEYARVAWGYVSLYFVIRFVIRLMEDEIIPKNLLFVLNWMAYLSPLFIVFVFLEEEFYYFTSFLVLKVFYLFNGVAIFLILYSFYEETLNTKTYFIISLLILAVLTEVYLLQQDWTTPSSEWEKISYLFSILMLVATLLLALMNKVQFFRNETALKRWIEIEQMRAVSAYKKSQQLEEDED
ncbi:MAG: hypothetical protein EAZ55_06530 [Cytophagales bacterium]|nr:MAG: hypothetical protein EAZ55_06530 [Cytophagales bacterium]